MSDPLMERDETGTISTSRHREVRYRASWRFGDILGADQDFDGLTLTIEVSGHEDAMAMIEAIRAS